jgi:hypothetical protein
MIVNMDLGDTAVLGVKGKLMFKTKAFLVVKWLIVHYFNWALF